MSWSRNIHLNKKINSSTEENEAHEAPEILKARLNKIYGTSPRNKVNFTWKILFPR